GLAGRVRCTEPLHLDAFGDHDDAEVLAAAAALLQVGTHLVHRGRHFGDQDHVRPSGQPAHERHPAGLAAHDLYHQHAMVSAGGGVQLVQRLAHGVDGGVETDAV